MLTTGSHYAKALLLIVVICGCRTPEERWMASQDERITTLSAFRDGKLIIETRYTLPLMLAHQVKTGKEPKENVLSGAKDICMGIVNMIGTIAEPIYAAIPIAGFIGSAVVQKVGDTQFVAQTVEIPLDNVEEVVIEFETGAGRKDIKMIKVTNGN